MMSRRTGRTTGRTGESASIADTHQDPVYVTRADAPVTGKVALCRVAAADTSRCTVVISVRGSFGGLSGRNFHLTDAR